MRLHHNTGEPGDGSPGKVEQARHTTLFQSERRSNIAATGCCVGDPKKPTLVSKCVLKTCNGDSVDTLRGEGREPRYPPDNIHHGNDWRSRTEHTDCDGIIQGSSTRSNQVNQDPSQSFIYFHFFPTFTLKRAKKALGTFNCVQKMQTFFFFFLLDFVFFKFLGFPAG